MPEALRRSPERSRRGGICISGVQTTETQRHRELFAADARGLARIKSHRRVAQTRRMSCPRRFGKQVASPSHKNCHPERSAREAARTERESRDPEFRPRPTSPQSIFTMSRGGAENFSSEKPRAPKGRDIDSPGRKPWVSESKDFFHSAEGP